MEAIIYSKKGFYFGDPCYVLDDELYYRVWGNTYNFENCVVTDPTTGMQFAVHGTKYGDGGYSGSDGNVFGVDSGTLALIPLELVKKADGIEFGGLYLGEGDAHFSESAGMFKVYLPDGRDFAVNTEDEDEDYEEDYDEMGYDPYLGCYTGDV